jgi:hypothetical protein
MTVGELVFANVVDDRVFAAHGDRGPAGVYLVNSPGRALPFTISRAWKVGTGMVTEEVQFYGPSGRLVHRWGPKVRRMLGSMDLTVETDRVDDAVFDETGTYLASFVIDEEIVGEIEVPVYVQAAPAKLPKEVEDGFRKSDVIWLGVEVNGIRRSAPSWFAYKNGRLYVLSQREPGPQEQTIPGLPNAKDLLVVSRRKGRDTALDELHASVRLLEGAEWEEAAKALVDRRRSRVGPPADSITRWRGTCDIAELTPLVG